MPPAKVKLPQRSFLLSKHGSRAAEASKVIEQTKAGGGETISRRTIVGGRKHYCKKEGLDGLKEIRIGDLDEERVNSGVWIPLRIVAAPFRTVPVNLVAEDQVGDVVSIHILHIPRERPLDFYFRVGCYFALREPQVRAANPETGATFVVRVESPSDLVWDAADDPFNYGIRLPPPSSQWTTPSLSSRDQSPSLDGHAWKTRGNSAFSKGQWYDALSYYSNSLELWNSISSSQTDTSFLVITRSNRAAAYLKINLPGAALRDIQIAMSLDSFSKLKDDNPTLIEKALYRAAAAEYSLRRFVNARATLQDLLNAFPSVGGEIRNLLARCEARLQEASLGRYDWPHLFEAAKKNKTLDVADYVGPVSLERIHGHGRGLVTTRQVKAGELLMVSSPLAACHVPPSQKDVVLGLDQDTSLVNSAGQVEVSSRLTERVLDDPQSFQLLQALYPGPSHPFPDEKVSLPGWQTPRDPRFSVSPPDSARPQLDVGRLESVATFNAFRPDSIATPEGNREEETDEETGRAASAVYFLASLMNSRCLGNALYCFYGDTWVLHAIIDVPKGEQIFDTYFSATLPLKQRRKRMGIHGYVCDCELCKWDVLDGEEAEGERETLVGKLQILSAAAGQGGIVSESKEALISRLNLLANQIDHTYAESQHVRTIKPALFSVYRIISRLREDQENFENAIEAESACLAALGINCDEVVKGNEAPLARTRHLDVLLACLSLASLHKKLAHHDQERSFIGLAKRLDRIAFGPGLALTRHARFDG